MNSKREYKCPISGIECKDCAYLNREDGEYNCFLDDFIEVLKTLKLEAES
jgi:hypothetical protein